MIKQVWDQNQGFKSGKYESNTAYKRFREFLELGPSRSVTAMAAAHDVTVQAMYQTSSKYNWKERAIAWDKEQKRLEREGKRMAKQSPRRSLFPLHRPLQTQMERPQDPQLRLRSSSEAFSQRKIPMAMPRA